MTISNIRNYFGGTLRGRLILSVALVHAVMMTLFIFDLTLRQRTMLREQREREVTGIALTLSTSAAEWLAAYDTAGLQELIESQCHNPNIVFAILTDRDGHIFAHTDKTRKGDFLLDLPREPHQVILGNSSDLIDIATPAILAGHHVGWVRIGLGNKTSLKQLDAITLNGTLYALAAILIGAFIAWRMGLSITQRLYLVQETISAVQSGNRDARCEYQGVDEAAQLAHEFNLMLNSLAAANIALKQSEMRYKSLFESVGVSLWEEDFSEIQAMLTGLKKQGISDLPTYINEHPEFVAKAATAVKIMEVNNATLKLYQAKDKTEILGSLEKIFVPESFDIFRQELIAIAEGKSYFEAEAVNGTLKGGRMDILMMVSFPPELQKIGRLTVSIVDITALKKAEKELNEYRNHLENLVDERTTLLTEKTNQLKKSEQSLLRLLEDVNESRQQLQEKNRETEEINQELKEFAYVVSHDLKAPLRAISQLTHWVAEDYSAVLDADGLMKMDLIIQRAKRMDNLIDAILRYSRISKGRMKEAAIDLNPLVNEVIAVLSTNTQVKIAVDNKLPTISGDSVRLGQVFQNLIGNAIKFMDKGDGVVNVGCSDETSLWKFYVSDNGPGIEEKYHQTVFQIFQTLTPRDERESTGIGLSLVKKIINLYGGTIWIESTVGEGTTFFFTLPKKGGEQ